MVFTTFRNLMLAIIFAGLLGFPLRASSALQSAAVDLVSPGVCPSGGCAAGQRLNFKVDFSVDKLVSGGTQNDLMVCMYAPQNWAWIILNLPQPVPSAEKCMMPTIPTVSRLANTHLWAQLAISPFQPQPSAICCPSACASENPLRQAPHPAPSWCAFTSWMLTATGER